MKINVAVLTALIVLACGCTNKNIDGNDITPLNVQTRIIETESREIMLEYVGFVTTESIVRYGFKLDGRVEEILVRNGQSVVPGQLLARLDPVDYSYDLDNARLVHSQSVNARNESQSYLDKLEQAFEEGGISRADIERVRLDYQVKQDEERRAAIDLALKERQMKHTGLYSDIIGLVIEIPVKEGEIVGAGTPVAVVGSAESLINIGVAPGDLSFLSVDQPVTIDSSGTQYDACIRTLTRYPDEQTNTYEVQIAVLPSEITPPPLGSLVKVRISKGTEQGFFLPIGVVNNDGEDFVFVANDNRAQKQYISLGEISGPDVRINGLESGTEVIVEGFMGLRDGELIQRKNKENNS